MQGVGTVGRIQSQKQSSQSLAFLTGRADNDRPDTLAWAASWGPSRAELLNRPEFGKAGAPPGPLREFGVFVFPNHLLRLDSSHMASACSVKFHLPLIL